MQVSPEQRVDLVSNFIETLIDQGCSRGEVCKVASAMADVLEAVADAGVDPCEFINLLNADSITDKQANALLAGIGEAVPWGAVGSAMGSLFNTGVGAATQLGTSAIQAAGRNIPLAVAASLAAPAAVGYGAGKMLGSATDDPDGVIDELKHQELISLLRQNAATLRRRQAYMSQQR